MAAVAILIGYGMADLALNITQVLLVLGITLGVGPDFLMAVFALGGIRIIVAGSCRFSRTVKLLAVAIGTEHAFLRPVNVCRIALIFPEVFGTDAGAMAGSAVILS